MCEQGIGGEGGIRTHGTRKGTTVFETVPIDHSGTSPQKVRAGSVAPTERQSRRDRARGPSAIAPGLQAPPCATHAKD